MSRDRARSREAIRLGVLAAVVAASVAGVAVGGRPALHATGLWSDRGSATVSPTFFDPTPSGSASTGAEGSGFGVAQSAAPASQGPVPGTAALAAAIKNPPAPSARRRLDIGFGVGTTILELAQVIATFHGAPEPHINGKYRDGDVRYASTVVDAAVAELEWSPRVDLTEGIARLQDWIAAQNAK